MRILDLLATHRTFFIPQSVEPGIAPVAAPDTIAILVALLSAQRRALVLRRAVAHSRRPRNVGAGSRVVERLLAYHV